ncbi:MAG: hypothetical protein K9L28_00030 [Synergistales bacterium]|nr:hypothetical protein [Synergistales bacterium]
MDRHSSEFTVFCDDLTGTSVQSILLKAKGLSPTLQVHPECLQGAGAQRTPSLLVVNAHTRGSDQATVENRFQALLRALPPHRRCAKRIDTTLRGHLYRETAALLEAYPRSVALVVPAYPASGRTTIGGYQLLNGSLLERTEVAADPLWPISTSYVPHYFQGRYPLSMLPMEVVRTGTGGIAKALSGMAGTHRIIIADAQNDADIEAIAGAAASLRTAFIPVDPGPFTAAYISRMSSPRRAKTALAVVGSTSAVTRNQLDYLAGRLNVLFYRFSTDLPVETSREECRRFVEDLDRNAADLLVIQPEGPVVRGREEATVRRLSQAGVSAMETLRRDLAGVILSGGDTAMGVFSQLGADFIAPVTELAPLMMGGRIKGTEYNTLKVVTKGGLVGGEDGLYRALQWIRQEDSE